MPDVGEQRLNHTEVNREHVWRLLQGGELIAPVPPLPPRETLPEQTAGTSSTREAEVSPVAVSPVTNEEAPPPPPPAKKTRARKKAEPKAADTAESGNMERTEAGETPPAAPPKRGRKKKTVDEAEATVNMKVKTSPESTDPAKHPPTDACAGTPPAKPKRTRRVGEPKPKRYPVGEKDPEQGM
jgi:hypothetical protein